MFLYLPVPCKFMFPARSSSLSPWFSFYEVKINPGKRLKSVSFDLSFVDIETSSSLV